MSRARKILAAGAWFACVALSFAAVAAHAKISFPPSSSMQLGPAAFAPRGYLQFCERRPDQCGLPEPIAPEDGAALERELNRQQWANVLNLKPASLGGPDIAKAATSLTAPPPLEMIAVETDAAIFAADIHPVLPDVNLDRVDPPIRVYPSARDLEAAHPSTLDFADIAPALPTIVPGPLIPDKPANLPLTPALWSILNEVNRSINVRIRPMDDAEAFRETDYWTLPLSDEPRSVGDCKDYALEKRKALVEAGISADVLSLAVVRTGWGETHAVLVVGTDRGDYVLDNLSAWIVGWQDSRYVWIERQTPGQPLRWALVSGPAKTSQLPTS